MGATLFGHSLRKMIAAELDDSIAGYEYFIHGTTADVASKFQLHAGKHLFTTLDPNVARMFAARTAAKSGGDELGGIVIVLPRDVAQRLRQTKLVTYHC